MTRGWDSTRYGVFQRLCVRVNLTLCSYPTQAVLAEIAEAHGGAISVTSQPDKRSVFTLRLPVPDSPDDSCLDRQDRQGLHVHRYSSDSHI